MLLVLNNLWQDGMYGAPETTERKTCALAAGATKCLDLPSANTVRLGPGILRLVTFFKMKAMMHAEIASVASLDHKC